ncbi:hypothetical protein MBLNU459_g7165t1 [Dothideomycetes sp. NU459]
MFCPPPTSALSLLALAAPWLLVALVLSCCALPARCMTDGDVSSLRDDARYVFYHGLTNYHRYAYPEDELRPLSCKPLTRDRANPAHIEVNDVLGNYSLSIVDSLSTLAILASSPTSPHDRHDALKDFQKYVRLLTEEYGDGSPGPAGRGRRARGFDLDSKVQLFETTIRGLGGLLSAHLFAVGELPIRGYNPVVEEQANGRDGILWDQGFVYDGQLLRLALDLGSRLLPAFHTPTGLPYPRVNLRHGIPFYQNSPLNNDAEHGQCAKTRAATGPREVTETCSAGAGSLVLEFTVLSRLSGDAQYERLAKRAFWAVWERRSGAGLIGAGIDAETGSWIGPFTGIGAGIDSFFEYAFKSHILLSGSSYDPSRWAEDSPDAFLHTWQDAHAAISRHILRDASFQHPHYAQNDIWTGGPRLSWIDSLSAYYPGLLALAGEVDEAATAHLLYTALWSRYGALPERWNTHTGTIDSGLRWWGGRPEFIESTWYLYRATKDPWYLHVGEMTLRDIKRRCWTKCGWAGLQDVRTGEQSDRMESFFLGETAKYLYLLFDPDHPLNSLDAPFVFTTEGHPLIIPKSKRKKPRTKTPRAEPDDRPSARAQCPVPPPPVPFSISVVAARPDVFHAASLARLHLMPNKDTPGAPLLDFSADHPSVTVQDVSSPSNYTYYPWTLPLELVPHNGVSAKMAIRPTFDLSFPSLPNTGPDLAMIQKIAGGILINSISGLRFGMILEDTPHGEEYRIHSLSNLALGRDESIFLNRDTLSQINPTDPHFTRMRDTEAVDLIIDATAPVDKGSDLTTFELESANSTMDVDHELPFEFTIDVDTLDSSPNPADVVLDSLPKALLADANRLAERLDGLAEMLEAASPNVDLALRSAAQQLRSGDARKPLFASEGPKTQPDSISRYTVPGMLPTGPGAAPLPAAIDTSADPTSLDLGALPYQTILLLSSDLCTHVLPQDLAASYNILVISRGGCNFSDKLANIPTFAPSPRALQLVITVSFPHHEDDAGGFIRPMLDKPQKTRSGVDRRNPIAMVMVSGGDDAWDVLRRAASAEAVVDDDGRLTLLRGQDADDGEEAALKKKKKKEKMKNKKKKKQKQKKSKSKSNTKGKKSDDEDEDDDDDEDGDHAARKSGGIGVRRRYFFQSQGIRIGNLVVR